MIQLTYKQQQITAVPWRPEHGNIGRIVAFDTETEVVEDRSRVQRFVIGQAYAGGDRAYLIKLDRLAEFLTVHRSSTLVMHNAPFDVAVCRQEVGFDFHEQVVGDRLFDTSLLYRLVRLATTGSTKGRWSLAHVSRELLKIELTKEEDVRNTFGRFRQGDHVAYDDIPREQIEYAIWDVIATYHVFIELKKRISGLVGKDWLSHRIQLMGALALEQVSRRGIGFDLTRKGQFVAGLDAAITEDETALKFYGYRPGKPGVQKEYERILKEQGIFVPKTTTGKLSQKEEDLEPYRDSDPFVAAFLSYRSNVKLKSSFFSKLRGSRIHTRFNTLLDTGRTSSSDPNLQNLPKKHGVRDCFIPAPGWCFLVIDYSTVELCTLAQICLDRYGGKSKMAELINEGKDLHRWFAAILAGKPGGQVKDEERQHAKACNFGFPGGLGFQTFIRHAEQNFGITGLAEEDARRFKEMWLDAFPEMRLYLRDTLIDRHNFSSLSFVENPEIAVAIFKRIIGGEIYNKQGNLYSRSMLSWAFDTVLADVAPEYAGISAGSSSIKDAVLRETVITRTGRVRAKATYCQARNTPFQALAADGAKIAMYHLDREGFRVVNFVHDEFVIELPISPTILDDAARVKEVVITGMKEVVPDVAIRADWVLCDRWYKGAKQIFDVDGRAMIVTKNEDGEFKGIPIGSKSVEPERYLRLDRGTGAHGADVPV